MVSTPFPRNVLPVGFLAKVYHVPCVGYRPCVLCKRVCDSFIEQELFFMFFSPGCPTENAKVPFDTKDINMSEYLISARAEDFIGRQWLYRDVEDAFKEDSVGGVLIIGNPGTGKSAWASQLICSRTTSSAIHAHILGYHLCKYSDKNTQMAGKFVRNLAEMIARRLPEYGNIVSNSSYIQRSFNLDCIQNHDPVGCFEQTIITPLRNLKNEPIHTWFIIVDALDECRSQGETSHSIIYLLENKINRFPPWLKLIVTSRNESDALVHSTKITNLVIDPEDSRNLEDIEIFVTTRLYQLSPLLRRITIWFGDDSIESTTKVAAALLRKSQGNFLFVKELLKHWEHSKHELGNTYDLPKSLEDLYRSYFQRLYPRQRNFRYARHVLELLVSSLEPLTQKGIFEVLRIRENDLDEEYDFKNRLKELGHFLKYGENNTITLYHLSLTDWLTNESNEEFFVSKKKGHKIFSEYYLTLVKDGDKSKLSKHILSLAQHVAFGGLKELYTKEFANFRSEAVNQSSDSLSSGRTLLHLAATINTTDVLELLLRHFTCIDCVDNHGITPAFLAAEHGLVNNLALLVKKGANVNHKTKSIFAVYRENVTTAFKEAKLFGCYKFCEPPSFFRAKSKFFGVSLLHAAAKGGHVKVVRFLLANNAEISILNDVNLTPIQLAAENGHLEVVKILHHAGSVADQTALHHAATNNRLKVVDFLLNVGVQDECLKCDGSFYWLENIPEDSSQIYDDNHLVLCQTALHAAVASGHEKVVSRLLSEELNALNCYDHSGRSPLHEAVRKNHIKIVHILLEKQPQMIRYKCEHWQEVDATELTFEEQAEYYADICHCGYTSLHLAARCGYQQLAMSLIRRGARVDDRDCTGATPIHVAACRNQADLIVIFSHPNIGGDINAKTSNGSTPLHSAAACGAVEVIDYILDKKGNLTAVDDYGLTALHYSIRNIKSSDLNQTLYLNDNASSGNSTPVIIERTGHLSGFFSEKDQIKSTDRLHWLDTLLKLLLTGSDIDAVDIKGQTTLHIAAQNGLADAVNVLLQMNASLEKKDILGKTPLEVAVENARNLPVHLPFHLATTIEHLYGALRDHELVVFLLLYHGALCGKCKKKGGSLLHKAILKQQPYIVQLLMLKGASLRCKDSLGRTPLITFLQNSGKFIDVVLIRFVKFVPIECGIPFRYSVYHLLSYRTPTIQDDNFFYVKKCSGHDDLVCEMYDGPLAEALESHPKKHSVLSSCLDAEGFTPLHRAVQGSNLIAVRYLLANGANDSILSPHGYNALTLAVLYAGNKRRMWESRRFKEVNEEIRAHYMGLLEAEATSIELLRYALKNRGIRILCDSSKPEISIYHLSAFSGLVEFIDVVLKESDSVAINVNCPNSDGITPMYLAKFVENNNPSYRYDRWRQVIELIKGHGGEVRYPKQDAEYYIIYRRLFGELTLGLRPEQFRFVTSLTKLYENGENTSFRCSFGFSFDTEKLFDSLQSPLLLLAALEKAIGELPYQHKWRFRRSIKRCLREKMLRTQYFLKIPDIYFSSVEPPDQEQRKFQDKLLALMLMRHVELRYLSCIKSLHHVLRPFLDAKTAMKTHPRHVEKIIPYFYLSTICTDIEDILRNYLHRKRMSFDFTFHRDEDELYGHSDFVGERLNKLTGRGSKTMNLVDRLSGTEWPLEFLIKRFYGAFSQYDYLKILQFDMNTLNDTNVPLT